jgi:hypothetical protein
MIISIIDPLASDGKSWSSLSLGWRYKFSEHHFLMGAEA